MIKLAVLCGTFSILSLGSLCSAWTAGLVTFVLYIVTGGWRFIRVLVMTTPRDLTGLIRLKKAEWFIYQLSRKNLNVPKAFQQTVEKYPNKICFTTEQKNWTFQQVEDYSNRVANCFAELGFLPGEEVALFMESRPEFVIIWLGLSKIGVVSALINNNLKMNPLAHSITCVNSKAVIFGSELLDAMKDAAPLVKEKMTPQYFCVGNCDLTEFPAKPLDTLLKDSSSQPPSNGYNGTVHDRLVYIYTSGTTGLPKAAIIKHSRYISVAAMTHYMMPILEEDVLYSCLPLYHTAGGILAIGQCLMFGNTVAIRPKFSASRFWDDCIKYEATVTQYIGEICRYLLAQPVKPQEKQHKIKMIFGNGLRPQIWKEFQDRFGIQNIRELYGATEGNAHVLNIDNTVGAVGFVSRIAESVHPVKLIKIDEASGEPLRDKKGMCVTCQPYEVGELVGKIVRDDHFHSFDGYVNQAATKKKMYTDVFKKGDMAFASGDLLMMDEYGYLYFKDRTGDTFRWKGENVSTSEVEGVVAQILKLADCVVYGVSVPGSEGRAGMAAILDPEGKTDLNFFLKESKKFLPGYAIPLFIRFVSTLESTGTYKLKKIDLAKEEYDISLFSDPVYFLDPTVRQYVKLDKELLEKLKNGSLSV